MIKKTHPYYQRELDFDPDNEIKLVPHMANKRDGIRDSILIVGKSGSGKSYMVYQYCEFYEKLYPTATIYYISCKPLEEEQNLRKLKNIKQVDFSEIEEIAEDDSSYLHFVNKKGGRSLVIFDDSEGSAPPREACKKYNKL